MAKSQMVTLKVPGAKLKSIVPKGPEDKKEEKKEKKPARKRTSVKKPVGDDSVNESNSSRPIPKASLGAVNACLRALDKSGNPCRRWTRKPIELTSFTGYKFKLDSWVGEPDAAQNGTETKA